MYQFKVNGEFLELKKDLKLSFSFNNHIFGFEKIELSRTQEFSIPAVPVNNVIFNLANRPDYNGTFARSVFDAQMWYSGGIVNGKLYISSCNSKEYKCVFVFGELLKLKEIKDAGEIGSYLTVDDFFLWNGSKIPDTTLSNFCMMKYKVSNLDETALHPLWNFMPTVKLAYLIEKCSEYFGVNVNYGDYSTKINQLAIKLNGMSSIGSELVSGSTIAMTGHLPAKHYTHDPFFIFEEQPSNAQFLNVLVAKLDLNLNFTAHIPFSQQLGYGNKYYIYHLDGNNNILERFQNTYNPGFETVATIRMSKGHKICQGVTKIEYNGYFAKDVYENYSIPMSCKYFDADEKQNFGANYYLKPNLPKITFIDLLNIVAKITGTAILFDGSDNFSFYDFETWEDPESLDDFVISTGAITRTFNDFAQKNTISFKDDKSVLQSNKISNSFYVQNSNLEKEKSLYEIPLSGGNNLGYSTATDGFHKFLQVNDILEKISDTGIYSYEFGQDSDTLCEVVPGSDYLQQAIFIQNQKFLNILSKSTCINLKVFMRLISFFAITTNTTYIYKGIRYAVVSAKWSDNFCDFTLQKI